jgi:hypothetical protein
MELEEGWWKEKEGCLNSPSSIFKRCHRPTTASLDLDKAMWHSDIDHGLGPDHIFVPSWPHEISFHPEARA